MAGGAELATAYINILPSTSGLGKEIKKYLGDVEQKSEESGKESGNRFTRAFGKWAKRGALVAGAAAGAAIGAAVIGGVKSAVDQQQGQAVLSGLYGDAGKAASTLENLKKVAAGSPLDYTAYQEAAASLAYAGVEGDSAVLSLENVGKAIVAAGGDSSKLGQATGGIMKAINNGGIAMMDSLGQISESGVPILSGLAEHFGVGIDEVKKMASEGKVNITDVMSVMENATGDTFQQMLKAGDAASETFGSQWKMAKDNVQVALGGVLLPLIEKITPAIKPAGEAVGRFIDGLPAAFERVSNAVRENAGLLTNLGIVVGTLVAGMLLYRGVVVATAVVQKIMAAATMAWTFATKIARIATAGWAVQQRLLNMALRANPIGIVVTVVMLLVGAFILAYKNSETFRNVVQAAWAGIKAAASAVWGWIKNTLWPGILAAWDAIAAGAVWLYENAIKPAWDGIKAGIDAVWAWIRDTLWPGLQAAWTAIGDAAKWLYESIIKPVWDGIRIAIAIAVTAVLVYIDLLKWYFSSVIAPVAMWLWNNVMKPAWDGIKAAIGAVVDWFTGTAWPLLKKAWDAVSAAAKWLWQKALKPAWNGIKAAIDVVVQWFRNTAWPLLRSVINSVRDRFQWLRERLAAVWDAVRNRVIDPVVSWFRDTAWPIFRNVVQSIRDRFQWMRERLQAIWTGIKDRVVAPVANWFRDTLQPRITGVADKIKSAFETMRKGVKKAWDGIKSAARTPAEFVVKDVYNDSIRSTFNGVADQLDLPAKWRLPEGKVGFASGGVLPGYSPGRDIHQFYSPTGGRLDLSGGEAIMRPEFTRAVGGAAGVADLNRRARRGEAFAGGGVWGKIKGVAGDGWDWLANKASTIAEAVSDPLGTLTKLANKAVELVPGGGMMQALTVQAGKNAGSAVGDWLKSQLGSALGTDGAGGGPVGKAPAGSSRSLSYAQQVAASMGLTMTSFRRGGARTAGSGAVSLHALGRAMDFSNSTGPTRQMMAFFNAMHPLKPTELLYSPAGGRQWRRSGRQADTSGATKRGHYNHVHVGFKDGGVFGKPFLHDQGGWHNPGELSVNQTRKPEAVLTNGQWATMARLAEQNLASSGAGVQIGTVQGYTAEEVAREISREQRKRDALYAR